MKPKYKPGNNIALKVPRHEHEKTVAFYRDTLGFEPINPSGYFDESPRFVFGDKVLTIDSVDGLSQSEVWFQVLTSDLLAAKADLESGGSVVCNEIEPLPEDMRAMWVSSPSNTIHLIYEDSEI